MPKQNLQITMASKRKKSSNADAQNPQKQEKAAGNSEKPTKSNRKQQKKLEMAELSLAGVDFRLRTDFFLKKGIGMSKNPDSDATEKSSFFKSIEIMKMNQFRCHG